MSNLIKYIGLLFVTTLFVVGCKRPEPLQIDIGQHEPKLVLSSQVIPGQIMIVNVSKSFGALEYSEGNEDDSLTDQLLDQLLVDTALVTISYNNNIDTLFGLGNGFYISISTPQYTGTSYTLHVKDQETGMEASATSEMLPFVGFDSVSVAKKTSNNTDFIEVYYKINDPVGDNWYMINFYSTDTTNNSNQNIFNSEAVESQTLPISDQEYAEGNLEGIYKLYDWEDDTIFVSVSHIDKGYHEYLLARERSVNSFGGFLSEPVSFPSNVEGGYGYFTTHYPDVRLFEVK